MKFLRLSALVAGVACVTLLFGSNHGLADPVTSPMADVVFGNLGASGTSAVGTTSASVIGNQGDSSIRMAVSFVTGSGGPWQLSGVLRLGLGSAANDPVPFALIMSDNAGSLSDPVAMYDGSSPSITTTGLYDFTLVFGDQLQASTNYWLFLGDDSPSQTASFDWYVNAAEASPAAQNDSGWSFGGAKISLDGGQTWENYSAGSTAAFSIAAVPEPSTYCMALAGLACGGFSIWQRRKRS